MALPALAFFGLGIGGNMLLDKLMQNRQSEQAANQAAKMSSLFYGSPTEQAGPVQPGESPLMGRGPSLMGGEIPPLAAAQQMMAIGGPYQDLGADIIKSQLGYHAPQQAQLISSGVPGQPDLTTQMRYDPLTQSAVPIPGVAPRKPGSAVTIQQGPKLPSGHQWVDPEDTSKGVKPIPGMKTTEAERTAAGYFNRMTEAGSNIANLMADEPEQKDLGMMDVLSGDVSIGELLKGPEGAIDPAGEQMLVGRMAPSAIQSKLLNPRQQQYLSHVRDWIRAKLRKESGAVISQEEWAEEYNTYFPTYGDTPQTIATKAALRKVAEDAMSISAGGALGQINVQQMQQQHVPGDTWDDGQFQYRMNQDGSIDRRKL